MILKTIQFATKASATNVGKFHLLTSSKKSVDIHVSNTENMNKEKSKLLGVNIESRLNFDFHLNKPLK